jgi:hypothetical protein
MKKLFLLLMTIALTGVFSVINAQDKSGLSDKALSAQYKHEINLLNSEIKTVKIKLKADKDNSELKKDLAVKQEDLKELKSKKGVIDKAIKSKAAAEKAQSKAEKAQKKAEKSASDAQRLRETQN